MSNVGLHSIAIYLLPFMAVMFFYFLNRRRKESAAIAQFKEVLDAFKIPTLIRGTKGDDVLAACGQLNSNS